MTQHTSLQTLRAEHTALSAVLQSLRMMLQRGPGDAPESFFDVMRAMLFYIDEFPERMHHPKESNLLFPRVARLAPHTMPTIVRLEKDHAAGEAKVRELQHLLLAWELMGDGRRAAFEQAVQAYQRFYLEHMRLEETVILPAAQQLLGEDDWKVLDAAFADHSDPLANPEQPRDPAYDRLFTRIVMRAPAPIGVGPAEPSLA
jgi:hemerythrin-like domain-containing protein